MMDIIIEKMKISDIDETKKIEDDQNISIISKQGFFDDLNNEFRNYFIAKYDNEIVGYIGISFLMESMDILSLVTKKEYQKKHIATSLLNYVIQFAKDQNIKKILLEVRKSNIPAISLYEKFSFKKFATRYKYYPDNLEDAICYVLNLN